VQGVGNNKGSEKGLRSAFLANEDQLYKGIGRRSGQNLVSSKFLPRGGGEDMTDKKGTFLLGAWRSREKRQEWGQKKESFPAQKGEG